MKTILFIAIAFLSTLGYGQGPVGAYFLNGDAKDASGNGNDGTLEIQAIFPPGKNDPKPDTGHTGQINTALYFNGDISDGYAYVDVGTPSVLDFDSTKDFTISVWFKYAGLLFTPTIVTNVGAAWGEGYLLSLVNNSGKIRPRFALGATAPAKSNTVDVAGQQILSADTWYNYIVTVDRSNNVLKLYLDGVQLGLQKNSSGGTAGTISGNNMDFSSVTTSAAHGANLQIGMTSNFGTTCFLDGTLDDLFFYDRVLTDAEIQDLQNDKVPGLSGTTGVIEIKSIGNLKVYPNPCGAKLSVFIKEVKRDSQLEVLDLSGQVVYSKSVDSGLRINTISSEQLKSGMYLIRYNDQVVKFYKN
ncbi:MAG: LamG-like jellyroll fold domain-containing protein [Salibacteraceae bacterium]